jgi:hypothetical protein
MNPQLTKIFSFFENYDIAIIGSILTKGDEAADIDVLFFNEEEFNSACAAFDTKPITWHGYTGKIARANVDDFPEVTKPVQFIWHAATKNPEDHPHIIQLRQDTVLNRKKWFDKSESGWKTDKTIKVSPKKEEGKVIAVDFDGTIRDWDSNRPLDGCKQAINSLREKGYKILIHSCNSPEWIENWMNDNDIRFDSIWTDTGKPVAYAYLDDRAVRFTDWQQALKDLTNG